MLYNQKVIQNFFWKDKYKYPVLEIVPDMKTHKLFLYLFCFLHRIKYHRSFFFIHYFQQKYTCMQIQYKNNYAKYAAFMIDLIGFFFLLKRR